MRKPIARVHTGAALRFKRQILNADGSVAKTSRWSKNLILDVGLDAVAAQKWANVTAYCAIGTGTNPFVRDSGAVTFTSSGTTLTASAGFFEAGDVGRLFKPDTGSEVYITAFSSATEVTTNADPGASATEGTIWYVNRTALQTQVKRVNTYRTETGDCQTTYAAGVITHRRTYLFSAEVGAVTYREIGWSWLSSGNLFSGTVISGPGDSLSAGQQYLVIAELMLTVSPATSTPAPDVGSGGWNSEGDCSLASVRFNDGSGGGWSGVNTNGAVSSSLASMEPSVTGGSKSLGLATATFTLINATNAYVAKPAGTLINSAGSSYVSGTFTRDFSGTFSVSQNNGTIHGFTVSNTAVGNDELVFAVKFDTPQTKDSSHTVTPTLRLTWGRVLVN